MTWRLLAAKLEQGVMVMLKPSLLMQWLHMSLIAGSREKGLTTPSTSTMTKERLTELRFMRPPQGPLPPVLGGASASRAPSPRKVFSP